MSNDGLNVYNNYIKKHSLSGFKSGLKYGAYCYIVGTIFASLMIPLCLISGANKLANILILPLATLISNPIAWVAIGAIFILACVVVMSVATPLFYLAKDHISKITAQKKEKSEEEVTELKELQEPTLQNPERSITPVTPDRPKTQDRESGIVTPEVGKYSFVTATNKGKYKKWLHGDDIIGIAENLYKWNVNDEKTNPDANVFFAYSYVLANLETYLAKYKSKVEQGDSGLIFASIFCLQENHFVTLVVSYDKESKKFRAYYCDSFGKPIPNDRSDILNNTLGIDSSDIVVSKATQQNDGYNCGIFALINAKEITDIMMRAGKFAAIDAKLQYTLTPEQLIEERKKFAEVLEKDEHNRSRRISSDSAASLDSGHGSDSESTKTQRTEIRRYSTAGDGNNCFFHSVFGDDNSNIYRAEKAQEMRLEWYKFLSQFEHLDDYKMSKPLRSQLQTVFNGFLLKPDDLTGECDKIKELVAQTNKKINEAADKVQGLKWQIMKKFRDDGDSRNKIYAIIQKEIEQRNIRSPNNQKSVPSIPDLLNDNAKLCNEIQGNLESCALELKLTSSKKEYGDTYDPEVIKDSFINNQDLYKAYLEAIKGPYQVFIEEMPILASLAGTKIEVYRQDSGREHRDVFEPDPEMMVVLDEQCNSKVCLKNIELWGNKKEETIHLTPGHYERAELVEVEPSLMEKANSVLQGAAAVCAGTFGFHNP